MTNTNTTTTETLEQLAERMAVELDRQRERATGMFAAVREMRRRLQDSKQRRQR